MRSRTNRKPAQHSKTFPSLSGGQIVNLRDATAEISARWSCLRKQKKLNSHTRNGRRSFFLQIHTKWANETAQWPRSYISRNLNWRCALEAKTESRSWLLWLFSFSCVLQSLHSPRCDRELELQFCFLEHSCCFIVNRLNQLCSTFCCCWQKKEQKNLLRTFVR